MFVEPHETRRRPFRDSVPPNTNCVNGLLILGRLYFSVPPPRERLLFTLLPGSLLSARTASLGEQLLKPQGQAILRCCPVRALAPCALEPRARSRGI